MSDQRLRDLYQNAVAKRSAATRADCPDADALLALTRREGSEEERLRTLDHAMSCSECMRELELLRAIEQAGTRASGASPVARRDSIVSWQRRQPCPLRPNTAGPRAPLDGRERLRPARTSLAVVLTIITASAGVRSAT